MTQNLPPPPPGFVLQDQPSSVPAPPPGFELVRPSVNDGNPIADLIRGKEVEQPSTLMDVVKSGLAGLRQGVESAIGGFGDVGKYQEGIAKWAGEKLGLAPETTAKIASVARYATPFPTALTTDDIRGQTDQLVGPAYEPQTTAGGYAKTAGEFLPGLVGGKGSLVKRAVTNVLLPAIGSETAANVAQKVAPSAEPYARVVGALVGAGLPSLASRTISPFPASPERTAMVRALEQEGVDLTAGQKTGSNMLRYAESELGGSKGAAMMEKQGEQFTAAILKRAGIDAPRATPEVIDSAFTRIGQQFEDLAAKTTVPFDQQLQNDMLQAVSNYHDVSATTAPVVERMMNRAAELAGKNGGVLSGEAYKNLRSEIGAFTRKADGPTKEALGDLQGAIDDAVERHMPQQFMDDWRTARGRYRNMLVIEKAATGAGENAAHGLVSPSALRNATVQQGRRAYARGQGDFSELARAGEGVMRPLPQSGTAPRAAVRGAFSTMGGIAGASGGGGLSGGVVGALAGLTIPPLVGKAMLSKVGRALLSNQVGASLPTVDPKTAAVIAALASRQQALPSN